MSNNKQSSLQWLTMTLSHLEVLRYHGGMKAYDYLEAKTNAMIQAKAMHKEEIINALLFGDVLSPTTAENYYKVKFGGNDANN